jgi:hypothetical protein
MPSTPLLRLLSSCATATGRAAACGALVLTNPFAQAFAPVPEPSFAWMPFCGLGVLGLRVARGRQAWARSTAR